MADGAKQGERSVCRLVAVLGTRLGPAFGILQFNFDEDPTWTTIRNPGFSPCCCHLAQIFARSSEMNLATVVLWD